MTNPETPWPPPAAALIRRAREAQGMSYADAAGAIRIRLKDRRWRQIEDGYESRNGRIARGGPMQLAHMAYVVKVTPDQLREAGEPDAAEILQTLLDTEARTTTAEGSAHAHNATVSTLEGRTPPRGIPAVADDAGLPPEPPFPKPKTKGQAAVNRYWEALMAIAEGEGDETPPADRTVRTLKRAALDLEEFRESAEGVR